MIELWVVTVDGSIDLHTMRFLWQVDVRLRQYKHGTVKGYHWHRSDTGCHGSSVIGNH